MDIAFLFVLAQHLIALRSRLFEHLRPAGNHWQNCNKSFVIERTIKSKQYNTW